MENFFTLILVSIPQGGQTRMSVLLKVLDKRSFSHIYGQLANIGNVVTNSLEVFGYEKQTRVSCRGCRLGDHHLDELMKYLVVEFVDLNVALNYFAGRRGIAGGKSVQGSSQHSQRMLGHAS